MNGEVLKSFLVSLGFGVDDKSLNKFNKSIASATLNVTALYTATQAMAAGIAYGISKVSEDFEQLGYEYRIIAPAINKALLLRRELLKAYSAAGINITKVIQSSVRLNFSLAKTKFAFQALYQSVASKFFDKLRDQSDKFRDFIYDNMPHIQAFIERVVTILLKVVEAISILGVRLYTIFKKLDEATGGWSTKILAAAAAWQVLNLAFLSTPLGIIIAGLILILALYDDFKTFQEGGKSYFENFWKGISEAISDTVKGAKDFWRVLQLIGNQISQLAEKIPFLSALYKVASGASAAFSNYIGGNPNVAANIQNGIGGVPQVQPLGAGNINNAQTNQNVSQQTTINVQSTADAASVGKSVAGEQSRVNYDMVANLQPVAQ